MAPARRPDPRGAGHAGPANKNATGKKRALPHGGPRTRLTRPVRTKGRPIPQRRRRGLFYSVAAKEQRWPLGRPSLEPNRNKKVTFSSLHPFHFSGIILGLSTAPSYHEKPEPSIAPTGEGHRGDFDAPGPDPTKLYRFYRIFTKSGLWILQKPFMIKTQSKKSQKQRKKE